MENQPFVTCDNLVKIFKVADLEVVALQGLDLEVNRGETMALVGPSGAGKSTLLNIMGGLDTPSAGGIWVAGLDLLKMSKRDRVRYKRDMVGFVWQQPGRNLLPYLSARENVELPMQLSSQTTKDAGLFKRLGRFLKLVDRLESQDQIYLGPAWPAPDLPLWENVEVAIRPPADTNSPSTSPANLIDPRPQRTLPKNRKKRAMELLDLVGLADRANFRPDRLSGGQQQRAALAVALANNPPLLLADELTGQIDSESASQVFEALRRLNQAFDTTIIVVTHDPTVASQVDRVVAIRDGRTSTEIRRRRDAQDGSVHEEEWVILDQTGRLQLPRVYVDTLRMKELVKVRLEPTHVSVWPKKGSRSADQKADPGSSEELLRYQRLLEKSRQLLYTSRATAPTGPAAVTQNLSRTFRLGVEQVHAIQEVSLEIKAGSLTVIKGRSGSGKTTLLNLIAGLDEPTKGAVIVGGRPLAAMSLQEKINLRRRHIGFVYQTFGLLPFLSVEENVQVPLRLVQAHRRERQQRTAEVLELVGLSDRARHRTYELSGGEQQRVAIARALVNQPSLILADEPTGQLDTLTGASIISLLKDIVLQTGVTVVVASHDPNVHQVADWIYALEDGRLIETLQIDADEGEAAQADAQHRMFARKPTET